MKKEENNMEYSLVICGGTFDRLHYGHKAFLRYAFQKGKKVIIGLTSDAYVKLYKKEREILPFVHRKEELEAFLQEEDFLQRSEIVAINSRFDQTQIPESSNAALLVSKETESVGKEINEEREKKNLLPLPLLVFPLVTTEKGEKVSSSKIRTGHMNREGILLPEKEFLAKTLFVPPSVRRKLHKPFGLLIKETIPDVYLQDPDEIVTVGDVSTKRLHLMGIMPKLCVVDFQVERKKTNETLMQLGFTGKEEKIIVENPAGQLSQTIWNTLLGYIGAINEKKNSIIVVDGEEDLLVIPLILLLPIGFHLFYGQPGEGIVLLEISRALKEQTLYLIEQFEHE